MQYLRGFDIGGTGAKAGVFTQEGRSVGEGYVKSSRISHVPSQAEHDAENWWQCAISAHRQASHPIDTHLIPAIGVGCTNGLIADVSKVRVRRE